ncbi:MAG: TlpA family protein disulfide reductase [Burkholderiales bacterium]|nr:TlpA family protein disulfide reductase [Burkholderiales bacterium]
MAAAVGGVAAAAGYGAHLWRIGSIGAKPADDAARAILESRLTTLDGVARTLEDFRGRILIINYWATWCAPCREEIPMFVRLQQELSGNGVQFIGIAVDQADKVFDFSREFGINYPLFIGGIDAVDLSRKAGNRAGVLPYTLVLDRFGAIRASLVGELTEARLRGELQPLLSVAS